MIYATITFLAGAYIVYKAVLALNKMDLSTRHMVRAAYIALGSSGMAFMASGFIMREGFAAIAAICVALFLAGNRRRGEVENEY